MRLAHVLRRSFLLLALPAPFALAAPATAPAAIPPTPPAAAAARPNILFISVDDLRDWTGYLGHNRQAKTPNIDRLARQGTVFTRAYCASPSCNPSRAALMSGLRPNTSGVYENNNDWRRVISEDKMLTTTLRRAGYYVCGAGKIYHEYYPRRSEWDDYLEKEGGLPAVPPGVSTGIGGIRFAPLDCRDDELNDYHITDYGIEELKKPHDKPFFLAIGLHKPHMPWNVPRKYYDLFPLDEIELPPYLESDLDDIPPAGVRMAQPEGDHARVQKSGRWKEAVRGYLAATAYTDMNIGRLLEALEKSPYAANTIVCLWGDHGWHLGEKHHWRKFALWEEATRTPLIWLVPGLTKPGSVCDRPVDLMSLYPTLTDLCGIPTPAHLEGRSVKPLLADPHAAWDTPALITYQYNNHAVRNDGWRYIRYANGDEELYDEHADVNEWKNLATDPAQRARMEQLRAFIPTRNAPNIGGPPQQGAEDFGDRKQPKARQQ
ncbi:sulfatase [Opitutus sp. ER46]|uniref:sulfatase n=1 Tax=Opitutus sp. ER46 TaxID=2161864 RepID=UPI000D326C56|nr:sulfatase [Opitutus sp. ER46]PTX98532.1 iduronate-2-sulfatase [Opitutus sp. ER46]